MVRAQALCILFGLGAASCVELQQPPFHDGSAGRSDAGRPGEGSADAPADAALDAPSAPELGTGADPSDGASGVLISDPRRDGSGEPVLDAGAITQDASASAGDAGGEDARDESSPFHEPCGQDAGTPRSQSFTVPPDGGRFAFCAASGGVLALDFPPSAAGREVTATNLDPQSYAWANLDFAQSVRDLIKLEPADAIFADPIYVRLPYGALLGFTFDASTGMPNPLLRTADHSSQLLYALSLIGVTASDTSCEVDAGVYASGWKDEAKSGMCSAGGPDSTYRSFACAKTPFCYVAKIGCCVGANDPGVECKLTDKSFGFPSFYYFQRIRPDPDQAYCEHVGVTPYVHATTPARLVANGVDQTVRLVGNHFVPDGFAFMSDVGNVKANRWLSSTEVEAVISGDKLKPGTTALTLEYINAYRSDPNSDYGWDRISNSVTLAVDVASVVCPLPTRGAAPIGECGPSVEGCACKMVFDSGAGPHTYAMICDDKACSCRRDGEVIVTSSTAALYACDYDNVVNVWDQLCRPAPGFCP